MNDLSSINTVGVLALVVYLLVKELLAKRKNSKENNPNLRWEFGQQVKECLKDRARLEKEIRKDLTSLEKAVERLEEMLRKHSHPGGGVPGPSAS